MSLYETCWAKLLEHSGWCQCRVHQKPKPPYRFDHIDHEMAEKAAKRVCKATFTDAFCCPF